MPAEAKPAGDRLVSKSTWLCRGDFDRERMLDMEERLRPARRKTFVILAVAIGGAGPWVGWWPLLFILPAAAFFALADRHMPNMERPELLMFASWIVSELMIAGAVALEGGKGVTALCWLAIPAITLSARFSMRGVIAGVLVACGLAIVVAFAADTHPVLVNPQVVLSPLALVACVAVLSVPLMRSDIQHRSDAVIDQLTGMLNRKALSARALELGQQSEVTGDPVGLIVADLDHFKDINDTHGHTVGDAVLRDVAYVLRKQLRAFELAYRLGGEEFLILVPGSDAASTAELAERLRQAVAAERLAGLEVTASFGVAASRRDQRFNYASVFAQADAALYRAKRGGRDQVCADGIVPAASALASA